MSNDETTTASDAGDWPIPARTSETEFFWEGTILGELRVQRCAECRHLQHPPRAACPSCYSLEWDHVVASGSGTVFSYAVHHRPAVPGPQVPYTSAIIQLQEGVRMLSNIVDTPLEKVAIDAPVQVVFREVAPGLTLPLFRVSTDHEPAPKY